LDVVRGIAFEADELDELARTKLMANPDMEADFMVAVANLNEDNPLMGNRVTVYGTPVTTSFDGETLQSMALASSATHTATSGHYRGMTARTIYDPFTDSEECRLLHMIYIGSGPLEADETGNMHQMHYYNYVLGRGSEIVPFNPVNAHSLVELQRDALLIDVDTIALDEQLGIAEKIKQIGIVSNGVLQKFVDQSKRNHQRVSYLNSLNLLSDVVFLTSDFVLADKEAFETSQSLYFSERTTTQVVYPDIFQMTNGYSRLSNGTILPGGAPELYIEGTLEDGQAVLAPFKGLDFETTLDISED
jgi:hypothetical protein